MRAGSFVGVVVAGMIGVTSCSSSHEQGTDAGATSGGNDAHFDIAVDGAPRPGTVRMAVPAYFGGVRQPVAAAIAGAPTVGSIVFNPDSGPGAAADPGYAR